MKPVRAERAAKSAKSAKAKGKRVLKRTETQKTAPNFLKKERIEFLLKKTLCAKWLKFDRLLRFLLFKCARQINQQHFNLFT